MAKKSSERRNTERLPAPKMLELKLASVGDGHQECACLLRDVSPGGFMAELTRGEGFDTGDRVQVSACAEELSPMLLGRGCSIRWRKQRLFGAIFDEPLLDGLEEALDPPEPPPDHTD